MTQKGRISHCLFPFMMRELLFVIIFIFLSSKLFSSQLASSNNQSLLRGRISPKQRVHYTNKTKNYIPNRMVVPTDRPFKSTHVVKAVRIPRISLCYDESHQKNRSTGVVKYKRLPYDSSTRNEFNDVYVNMYNPERMAKKGEFEFSQDHIVKYYDGSSPDNQARKRNQTDECYSYDITLTSQTS